MESSLRKEPREPSPEDRTTKKAKFREEDGQASDPSAMTFRDKVVQSDKDREEKLAGDLEDFKVKTDDVTVYENKSMPSISFLSRVQEELSKRWKTTVIIKLLDRPIEVAGMWKLYSQAAHGLFWGIIYQYKLGIQTLIVLHTIYKRFKLGSDCRECLFTITIKKVLRYIGAMVGRVIKIDYCTEAAERGKFARIAVEIDLQKPLVSQFCLDGKVQFVEYECMPIICFECGKFGHVKGGCLDVIIQNQADHAKGDEHVQDNNPMSAVPESTTAKPNFGLWMMVNRRGKPTNMQGKNKIYHAGNSGAQENQNGSRFQILDNDNEGMLTDSPHLREAVLECDKSTIDTAKRATDRMIHANKDKMAPKGIEL
ncbi:uncharacterized protein LOC126672222 [Mercurialis annua]|uniref:uncharacterized protein LOC126672222 n=1 Tax=Mercurialis annua TaxID=3986 RepID=UPI00215F810D|nr:uncharacterized protein LOC126672222 [Mercurialis annua]